MSGFEARGWKRWGLVVMGVIYFLLLVKVVLFKYPYGMTFGLDNANLIPFKTILRYLSGIPTTRIAIQNLLGNVVLFVPGGFLLGLLCDKSNRNVVWLAGLAIGTVMELLQLLLNTGVFDVDDIILNLFGVLVGYLAFLIIFKEDENENG